MFFLQYNLLYTNYIKFLLISIWMCSKTLDKQILRYKVNIIHDWINLVWLDIRIVSYCSRRVFKDSDGDIFDSKNTEDQYLQLWFSRLEECNKFDIFKRIKLEFCIEKYLDFHITCNVQLLTKIRSGTLKLNVETGRYIHRSLKPRLHNKSFTFEAHCLPLFASVSKSLYISDTIGGFADKIWYQYFKMLWCLYGELVSFSSAWCRGKWHKFTKALAYWCE
jgi:hypothetical protein